jgi:hypothetical protein
LVGLYIFSFDRFLMIKMDLLTILYSIEGDIIKEADPTSFKALKDVGSNFFDQHPAMRRVASAHQHSDWSRQTGHEQARHLRLQRKDEKRNHPHHYGPDWHPERRALDRHHYINQGPAKKRAAHRRNQEKAAAGSTEDRA